MSVGTSSILELAGRVRRPSATRGVSLLFTMIAVGFVVVLVALFAVQSVPVWGKEGVGYVAGKQWSYRSGRFGALPMIYGTAAVALVAMAVAVPLGLGAAVFTAEYLPRRARLGVKVLIELLAGIPSVVYGLLGVLFLRTFVYEALTRWGYEPLSGDSLLTAGLLLSVMILPTVMTLADDALRAVPAAQRQAARGLGLTRAQVICSVAVPQAWRGLVAAVLLALGRALGEMIAVFLVVGRRDNNWPERPFSVASLIDAGQTLSSKLGGSETNIAYGQPLHWAAMVGLGLMLLVIVMLVTLAAGFLESRGARHA